MTIEEFLPLVNPDDFHMRSNGCYRSDQLTAEGMPRIDCPLTYVANKAGGTFYSGNWREASASIGLPLECAAVVRLAADDGSWFEFAGKVEGSV